MPKRLLQYALSRLEILDTDALDLDNLDIVFGKNSVFEFRDVGLRLKVSILSCPACCRFMVIDNMAEIRNSSTTSAIVRTTQIPSYFVTSHYSR